MISFPLPGQEGGQRDGRSKENTPLTILNRDSRIAFIGAGTVGKSLAVALERRGYKVVAAASRTFSSAEALAGLLDGCVAYRTHQEAVDAADFVLVTSTDDAIGRITAGVLWQPGQGVAHCSGVTSLDVLEPAETQGALVGTIHPLQTFSSVEDAQKTLPGTTFAIEGEGEVRDFLRQLAVDLGGNPIFLRPQDKPLYHTSVVMMGGLLSGMFGHVADLWQHFGIDREDAIGALVPIAQGIVTTVDSVGIPQALAGPYVRGDVGTVRKHLEALKSTAPESLPVYCHMALAGLPYAFEKGKVPPETAAEIRRMLVQASASTKSRPSL